MYSYSFLNSDYIKRHTQIYVSIKHSSLSIATTLRFYNCNYIKEHPCTCTYWGFKNTSVRHALCCCVYV